MQILGIHTHALPRPFERTLKIRLFLQQTLVPRTFVIIHLGPRSIQPLGVVFFRDRASDRRRLATHNPAFSKPLGNAVLNNLADRPELFADGLRFSNQRLKYDVRFALLVAKISADDLLRGLELAVNAPIALFQPGRVPRQIEMNEVGAIGLKIDALPGRISADEDAQRLDIRVRVEGPFDLLSSIRSRRASEHTNAVISTVRVRHRLSKASFQPTARVLVLCEYDKTPAIPILTGKKVGFDPGGQPTHSCVGP